MGRWKYAWVMWRSFLILILGDYLIRPVFISQKFTSELWQLFGKNIAWVPGRCTPLATRIAIWFMYNGAPPHFSLVDRDFLKATNRDLWIGRSKPHARPARSPDFNPLDYFWWGYLKLSVYATPVENFDDLRGITP